MINKISFTGREEMLTKGIKQAVDKTHEYLGEANIFSRKEVQAIEKKLNEAVHADTFTTAEHTYTSPFDVIDLQSPTHGIGDNSSNLPEFNIFG